MLSAQKDKTQSQKNVYYVKILKENFFFFLRDFKILIFNDNVYVEFVKIKPIQFNHTEVIKIL